MHLRRLEIKPGPQRQVPWTPDQWERMFGCKVHRLNHEEKRNLLVFMTRLAQALERWAEIALKQGWVEHWVEGAIFPAEMVFFLAVCEANGVEEIIESGRQDGYSTEILGYYARDRSGLVASIDMETDRDRAGRCRQRLAGNPHLTLLRGDCQSLIGPLLFADRSTPTAVLIDGPKGYPAMMMLLAAAALKWVRVVAMHNLHGDLESTSKERQTFVQLQRGIHFYEDLGDDISKSWRRLRQAEKDYCQKVESTRSLELSSLGVLEVADFRARHLLQAATRRMGRYQPLAFYLQMLLWQRIIARAF